MRLAPAIALVFACWQVGPSRADDFERLDGKALSGVPRSVAAYERITVEELGNLPNALAGGRSPSLVVVTDQGNFARLQVVAGLRRPPGSTADPAPILVVERFAAFEAPTADRRLSRGRDLALFAGFGLDLDTGQVVPARQGADVKLDADGTTLVAVGSSRIYPITISPFPTEKVKARRPANRSVIPEDYAGRYRLYGDGRWSGLLELSVEGRELTGGFRSDETGARYKVTGRVDEPLPTAGFAVDLPRAKLEFRGHLFADGKGAIAGTVTLLDRVGGFVAVREGAKLVADDGAEPSTIPGAVEVVALGGSPPRYRVGEREVGAAALAESIGTGPASYVLLRMRPDLPYASLLAARDALRAAVDLPIRDAPLAPEPPR